MGASISESARTCDPNVSATTPALSLHIPDFLGPMTPEACDRSIAQAREFFPQYFPEEEYRYAVCHSWLLDPGLKTFLRPDSNIIRFQDRFTIAGPGWDSTDGIMQFVFGRNADAINNVPQDSSLQRGVVSHIRNGGRWWGHLGWFRMPNA